MNTLFCSRCRESQYYITEGETMSMKERVERRLTGGITVARRMTVVDGKMYCDMCLEEIEK